VSESWNSAGYLSICFSDGFDLTNATSKAFGNGLSSRQQWNFGNGSEKDNGLPVSAHPGAWRQDQCRGQVLRAGNPLLQMIFRVLMEEKLKASFGQSIANFGVLCEKAAVAGQAE
jgi:hypothetical protein